MSSSVPVVEKRIRFLARDMPGAEIYTPMAAEAPDLVFPESTPDDVLRLCPSVLDSLAGQLAAVRAALPIECLHDDAPFPRRT